ncbi:MAG: PD40 domain-containing protein [Gemmatimonadaceae bacterium]|nr:PD40 domain-containing protein [Gemmatimonadaceae bacterium]
MSEDATHPPALVAVGVTGNEIGVYVVDVQRGATTKLPVDGGLTAWGMTENGDSLLFSAGRNQLFIRAMDGSGTQVPVLTFPDWTPLATLSAWGPWIAFTGRFGGVMQRIGVAHRDSMGLVRPLSSAPREESVPAISPDGKWLAFTSVEDGREQVFVTAFPIPGGRLPVSTNSVAWPSWRRDSRTIYFQQGNRIMAADFDGAPSPR